VIWAVPAFLALHNVEEALTLRAAWPTLALRMPAVARPVFATLTPASYMWALVVLSLLALGVATWANRRPGPAATWAVAAIQATVALNVLSHLGAVVMMRGYAPGVLSAVVVNAPFSAYFFRRAVAERWLTRGALWATVPAAFLLHGPGLLALLALGDAIAGAG
jgi:hypothetical protein